MCPVYPTVCKYCGEDLKDDRFAWGHFYKHDNETYVQEAHIFFNAFREILIKKLLKYKDEKQF